MCIRDRPWTTTSGPVGFALPNSSEIRSPAGAPRPNAAPSRSTSSTTRCQNAGTSRRLMKPASGVNAATVAQMCIRDRMVTEDNAAARALYDGAAFVTERRMMTKPL